MCAAVLYREPLKDISMTLTQRPTTRRRSARTAFEDDEAQSHSGLGKKIKVDDVGADATNGTSKRGKRNKTGMQQRSIATRPIALASVRRGFGYLEDLQEAVYEANDDGFSFSRSSRSRKPKVAAIAPEPLHEETVQPTRSSIESGERKKDSFLEASRGSRADDNTELPKRRRSARLSGDKSHVSQSSEAQKDKLKAKTQLPERARKIDKVDDPNEVDLIGLKRKRASKAPASQSKESKHEPTRPSAPPPPIELHIEKTRTPKKIVLPQSDTPAIKRNKEMRKTVGADRRRSSSGLRGRRASSLIDSGQSNGMCFYFFYSTSEICNSVDNSETNMLDEITAMPHSEVETKDFYKHIEDSIPEPRRMKQLLIWCGSRALPEKPSGESSDTSMLAGKRNPQNLAYREILNVDSPSDSARTA
jgi:kinetochore protein Mis13/DSN1